MEIIKKLGESFDGLRVVVLDTPCYPHRYYGGPIAHHSREPLKNAPCNFHKTVADAETGAKQFLA